MFLTQDMPMLADSLSANISETPEGFIICSNVKIARTGTQDYLGQEIGRNELANRVVKVYRLAEDVFDQRALMSFEGKPVTFGHPERGVTPSNASGTIKGHVRNVRGDGDFIVADLVVMDSALIRKIKSGEVRQVSCGYSAGYVEHLDGYRQIDITGNHVAVVERGRAGPRVAITDSLKKGASPKMTRKEKMAKMFAAFAKDASPEEVIEMAEMLTADEAITEPIPKQKDESGLLRKMFGLFAKDEEEPKKTEDEDEEEVTKDSLADQVKKLQDTVDSFIAAQTKSKKKKTDDADWLDAFLVSDEDEEDTNDSDEEEDKKETSDAAMQNLLIALKPHLAKLPAKELKQVKDSIRKTMGQGTSDYQKIAKIAAEAKPTQDSVSSPEWHLKLGEAIMAEQNPHVKTEGSIAMQLLKKA